MAVRDDLVPLTSVIFGQEQHVTGAGGEEDEIY